jgi:protein-S-isoprenylcysteine O-methyltransferase Ste14
VTGVALALLGTAGTFLTQLAMGESWRVGVDETEQTELVTHGPVRTGPS